MPIFAGYSYTFPANEVPSTVLEGIYNHLINRYNIKFPQQKIAIANPGVDLANIKTGDTIFIPLNEIKIPSYLFLKPMTETTTDLNKSGYLYGIIVLSKEEANLPNYQLRVSLHGAVDPGFYGDFDSFIFLAAVYQERYFKVLTSIRCYRDSTLITPYEWHGYLSDFPLPDRIPITASSRIDVYPYNTKTENIGPLIFQQSLLSELEMFY